MTPLLKVQNVGKTYGKGANTFTALANITFEVEQGEFVGVMGPSGAGKSTLLNVLATIDTPTTGDIVIGNTKLAHMKDTQLADFRRDNLGFIFQDYNLLDSLTVRENIVLPLAIAKVPQKDIAVRVERIAQLFGIQELLDKYPYQISGGQKQRTASSRALVTAPKLIFADEPTGALDSKSASDLLNKLSQLNQKLAATIIMVTHDPVAASYCSRVIFIKDGQIYTQLNKGEESRQAFFNDIIKTQGVLGGVQNEH